MQYFDTKLSAIKHAVTETLEMLAHEVGRASGAEQRLYSDKQRAVLAAQIADIKSAEATLDVDLACATLDPVPMLQIESLGRTFNVRRIDIGDKYGPDDCFTYEGRDESENATHSGMVEFYDAAEQSTGEMYGTHVSRYDIQTLMNHLHDLAYGDGLFYGGSFMGSQRIDARAMREVFKWINATAR